MDVIMYGLLGEIRILKAAVTFSCNYFIPTVFPGLDFFIKLALETCTTGCFDFNLIHGLHKGFHFLLNVADKL